MNLKHGSDVFIRGVCYEPETNELEVYPRDLGFWFGIPMTQAEADRVVAKIKRHGVFFYEHIRYICV